MNNAKLIKEIKSNSMWYTHRISGGMKVEGVLLPADEVDVDDNRGMAFFPFCELTTHILNEIIEGNI